jgi:hypothetical protein
MLARVGVTGIPATDRIGAPGKSSRAIFAFSSPKPPLGSFTKEMGHFSAGLVGGTVDEKRISPSGPAFAGPEGIAADFFGASSVASALGIRSARPLRTTMPASALAQALLRQTVMAIGLHDQALLARRGDGHLCSALGTFGERHDLLAKLVIGGLRPQSMANCQIGLNAAVFELLIPLPGCATSSSYSFI